MGSTSTGRRLIAAYTKGLQLLLLSTLIIITVAQAGKC